MATTTDGKAGTGKSRKMTAKQKSAESVRLYKLGHTYDEIAAEVGYRDRSGAYRAVERAIADTIREPAEHVRRAEIARLDMALKVIFDVMYTDHVHVSNGRAAKEEVYATDPDTGRVLFETDPETGERHPVVERYEPLYDHRPKLEAVKTMIKLMERRAKLMGLDAPKQFEAVHPDLINEETNRLAGELGMTPEEIAAFDAEAKRLIEQFAAEDGD